MNALARARGVLTFSARVGRVEFFTVALLALFSKLNLDWLVASSFGIRWRPLDYVFEPFASNIHTLAGGGALPASVMLAISLPFLWLGIALVVGRLRDSGLPLPLAFLFFVPAVNVGFAGVLAIWPSAVAASAERTPNDVLVRFVPQSAIGSAALASAITALLGFALTAIGAQVLGGYGWGLFVAGPFAMGVMSALIYGARRPRTMWQCYAVALLSVGIVAFAMLGFALEGIVCIAMAAPLAGAIAVCGATFGYALQRRRPRASTTVASILIVVVATPAIMGADLRERSSASVFEVETTVEVAAPPAAVWRRVIAFPDLAAPTELAFRAGVGYPIRARIDGRGAGAIRSCEFSTGTFVEPITVWQPGRRLAFSVTQNAEPMAEWTPFAHVHPPHLDGYMESLHGEFDLQALPGRRTRLTGRTWYRHHLWPETYWRLWSDAIIHQIHARVLRHVARLAESDVAGAQNVRELSQNRR